MSKAVKSVGRAIGKVVKGAVHLTQKVVRSKLGKAALMAAVIYFGAPAINGAFGGAAGGGASGLSGALNGISNAWSGVTSAASSVMSGNFAQAGSQLASGMLGGEQALGQGLQTAQLPAAVEATSPYSLTGANVVGTGSGLSASALPPAATSIPPASKGILASLASSPHAAPALIKTVGQMASNLTQGRQMNDALQRSDQLARDERARYNQNVGTSLWGAAPRA